MPQQRGIPLVGANAANEVRLTPALRALLRRRITRQERREHNPEIAMLRQRRKGLKRGLRQEIAAIQGTADLATEAVTDIPLRGLKGSFRRQAGEDLAARAAAIQGAVPLLAAEARGGYREERAAATDDILAARIAKKQEIESGLSSALSAARTDAQSTIKARESRARSNREERKEERGESKEALVAALRRVENVVITGPGEGPWKVPESESDWRKIEMVVESGEGINQRSAVKAVNEARRYVAALKEAGYEGKELRQRLEAGLFPFG